MTKEIERLFEVNEVELIYRAKSEHPGPVINTQDAAIDLLRSIWDSNKIELVEQFKIVLLDTANICLGISETSSGGWDHCTVDPRVIFATALKAKATRIILAHNHPSGNLVPSKADISITEKLCAGGLILDIHVLDHFILTRNSYCSFASRGLIP